MSLVKLFVKDDSNEWVPATASMFGGGGGGGSSVTNLTVTVDANGVLVASSTGTDATIPLATSTEAGAMPPAAVTQLAGLGTASTAATQDFAAAGHTHSLLMTTDERAKLTALPVAADLTTTLSGKMVNTLSAMKSAFDAGTAPEQSAFRYSMSSGLVITDAAGNKILPGQATYSSYTADKLLNSSGGMDTSAGWSTSEFISCVPGTTYYVSKARFVAWFNISKALIPSLVDIPLASPPTTLIAPPGAVYFKYTVKTTDISAFRWNPGIVENVVGNYKLNDDVKLPALRSILIGWFKSEAYQITSDITYNAGGKIDTTVAATIEWPNGATGQLYVYYNGDWTVNVVSASYVGDGVRLWVNQPSITYSGGNPFKVPKCTVTAG